MTKILASDWLILTRMVTLCASRLAAAKMYRGAVTEITRTGPAFSVRMEHEGSPDTVIGQSNGKMDQ